MESLNDKLTEYHKQLQSGTIREAYQALMRFVSTLKNYVQQENPTYQVAGHLHQGTMDITFFAFYTAVLKSEKLKIVVLFNHKDFRFEVWLCGQNKQVQQKYWEIFSGSDWDKCTISAGTKDGFSIVEQVLDSTPDFDDLEGLKKNLSEKISQFVSDIEEVFV